MRITRIEIELEPGGLWVGVRWRWTSVATDAGPVRAWLDVWVGVIPGLPVRLTFFRDSVDIFGEPGRAFNQGEIA